MTEIVADTEHAPPLTAFLNTVCPGSPFLDENTHFSLPSIIDKSDLDAIDNYPWPLTSLTLARALRAHLCPTYLNIARPPFVHDVQQNIESTTYVPLALHIGTMFEKLLADGGTNKQDGAKHIGANVSPLLQDPFRLVQFNPGCMSAIITLNHDLDPQPHESRNPLDKVTSSFNRLLLLGGKRLSEPSYFVPLTSPDMKMLSAPRGCKKTKKPLFSILELEPKSYLAKVHSPSMSKLMVSTYVNIINVFGIDDNNEYMCTSTTLSTAPLWPQAPASLVNSVAETESTLLVPSAPSPHRRVTEKPLLRLELHSLLMVTRLTVISAEMLAVLGLNDGSIIIIDLANLTYRYYDDFGFDNPASNFVPLNLNAVSLIHPIYHPQRDLLLVIGYATGEVIILDPYKGPGESGTRYSKTMVGKDRFVTYFRKFDLSPFPKTKTPPVEDPPYLVGHFKLSHKLITAITSTLSSRQPAYGLQAPMILAISSDDGLARIIDLVATHECNYGDPNNFYNSPIITDIVSNYFREGIRCMAFSPDHKYFVLCGKGDLVEVFKMSYYNVNGLMHKAPASTAGRSRSGTVNSTSSSSHLHMMPSFLSTALAGLGSSDGLMEDADETVYPATIKDIVIVSRFKGHTNVVKSVEFVKTTDNPEKSDTSRNGSYNLVTCGFDAKINFWEFNSKALATVKKTQQAKVVSVSRSTEAGVSRHRIPPNLGRSRHTRSITSAEEIHTSPSYSNLGITNMLVAHSQSHSQDNAQEQLQIVFSLYKSLYEVRLKKFDAKRGLRTKYQCVVHPIVDDKNLPSLQVPLLSMNLAALIRSGSIQGFHIEDNDFFVFGKTGDIFRYKLRPA